MVLKLPCNLQQGSKVAITAFSSGVSQPHHERLDIVIKGLRDLGFEVIEGSCLRQDVQHISSSAKERANEFMAFLCDETIDAVFPPWGGEFAMDILPLLDFAKLAEVKPKWIMGFSDVSTILVALFTKLNWVTVHSANLMQLHPDEKDKLTADSLHYLSDKRAAYFVQTASERYQLSGKSVVEYPNAQLNTTEQTNWKVSGNGSRHMSGRLIGGCFDTLVHLIGSEYFDIEALTKKTDGDGIILYLENAEMAPTAYKRALQGLQYKGIFKLCSGLLIGRNAASDENKDITHTEALLSIAESLEIPVFYDVDIGHLPPNLTLFNGAKATIDISNDTATVTQTIPL